MDHLPLPEGAQHITVPYLCEEEYDGGEFTSYPERKGWTEETVLEQTQSQVDAFFQTWLFFGSLYHFLDIIHEPFEPQQFVRETPQGRVVTTEQLPSILHSWKARNQRRRKTKEFQPSKVRQDRRLYTFFILLRSFVDKFCEAKEATSSTRQADPKICLSIMILGETLNTAATNVSGPSDWSYLPWGRSQFLQELCSSNAFCPSRAVTSVRPALCTLYYDSLLDRMASDEHSDCTETQCMRDVINLNEYTTRHTKECFGCSHVQIPDEAISIIERGHIPLLVWGLAKRRKSTEYELHVVEYDPVLPKEKYVAISHVWSDGMGNVDQNSLPTCQLSQLQTYVTQLYKSGWKDRLSTYIRGQELGSLLASKTATPLKTSPLHAPRFWIDTLCVPRRPEHHQHRKTAIRMMGTIYSAADRVLVMESSIASIRASTTIAEQLVRLARSPWSRRLWTLQEGYLAKNLYFQFSDGAQPSKTLERNFLNFNEQGLGLLSTIAGSAFKITLSANFARLYRTTLDLPIHTRFRHTVFLVGNHITSKLSDEPVCIATMMGLDSAPLLNIPEDSQDDRMMLLLRIVKHFPPYLIFHTYPRLCASGFRWAPRSYLGQRRYKGGSHSMGDESWDPAILHERGLQLKYPGLRFGFTGARQLNRAMLIVVQRHGRVHWLQFYAHQICLDKDDTVIERSVPLIHENGIIVPLIQEYAIISRSTASSIIDEPATGPDGMVTDSRNDSLLVQIVDEDRSGELTVRVIAPGSFAKCGDSQEQAEKWAAYLEEWNPFLASLHDGEQEDFPHIAEELGEEQQWCLT